MVWCADTANLHCATLSKHHFVQLGSHFSYMEEIEFIFIIFKDHIQGDNSRKHKRKIVYFDYSNQFCLKEIRFRKSIESKSTVLLENIFLMV